MEKIRLEILGLSSSQTQPGSYALVLSETNGSRRLPIIIGSFEAQAIALEMENIKPNRPMTHDLFKAMAQEFGLLMRELVITSLHEGVFYSKIYKIVVSNRSGGVIRKAKAAAGAAGPRTTAGAGTT